MKKLIILLVICAGGLMCQTASAQLQFRVNIGNQPMWGPVGYDHVENYYLPDIEAYYNVPTRRYTYMVNGQWTTRAYLPERYRDYDMYNTRKIVINEPRPYLRNNEYRERYSNQNERPEYQSIRDSRDGKYFESRSHPQHSQYRQYTRQNGRYRGNGNNENRENRENHDNH